MSLHTYNIDAERELMLFNKVAKSVNPAKAKEMMDQGTLLIDVRELSEWNHGHAPGVLHIPLASLEDNLHRIPKDEEILVCCRSGNRSSSAVSLLKKMGIQAINLDGGMMAWQRQGLPIVNSKGVRGTIS